MRNRVLDNRVTIQIIQLTPLFANIVASQGLKYLGTFGSHNIRLLPREYLITATVVEDSSIFDRCLREAPVPMKLMCFKLAVDKAKSMGFRILALRLPTKWERFKLWGWKKLPTLNEQQKTDKSPIPISMRPNNQGVILYGQRLPR